MTWTAPATATVGQNVSAAFWNAQVRDNLLELEAAVAALPGDLVTADAANSMGTRLGIGGSGTTLVSTNATPVWRTPVGVVSADVYSGSYLGSPGMTDLSVIGGGDTVAVSAPTGTQALVMFGARSVSHNTAGSRVLLSYAVDGATTIAAAAGTATDDESTAADSLRSPGREHLRTGLTTGVNIFTLQVQPVGAASGSITVRNPYLIVWPL